ncbi:hypothetical protein [Roseococcus thiosulfatophilus]|uniref:hypothetical protein n=1 Tax=Roseococcus thiosulfatophilus TaxID=35813 RepID=UPI001A909CB6|nr:hypothetical protein [Roseococcus thiosulfatophilus]
MSATALPSLLIVPNGVHTPYQRGRTTLRLLLLALPASQAGVQAQRVTPWRQDMWPSRAHGWFDEAMRRSRRVEVLSGQGRRRLAVGRLRQETPATLPLEKLNTLWERAMGGAAGLGAMFDSAITEDRQAATPSAVPAPTLEASLLLPLERARQTLEAVAGTGSALAERPPVRPPMQALAAIGRPWLGDAAPMLRLAAAGAGTLDPALARLLCGPPDVGAWLDACAAGEVDAGHPYAKPLDPEAIAAAALGHGEEDLLWLSDRLHALHHAALHLVADNPTDSLPPETGHGGRRLHQLLASPALMRLFGFARDALLDFEESDGALPAGEAAVICALADPHDDDPASRDVGGVLDVLERGFFPAAPHDWRRLTEASSHARRSPRSPAPAPWAKAGLRILSPPGGPRVCAGSIEPTLCTEADHQCQLQGRPTRTITGPLSLFEVGTDRAESPAPLTAPPLLATDIAAPPRLHLGIDGPEGHTTWMATSARTVTLSDPWGGRDADWPARVLQALTPSWLPASERDAAGITNKATYQDELEDGEGKPRRAVCDPRLGAYHGDDLGAPPNELSTFRRVQPAVAPRANGTRPNAPPDWFRHHLSSQLSVGWRASETELKARDDLLVNQHFSIAPGAGLAPLVFGWSYRFALEDRTLGGGGAGAEQARRLLSAFGSQHAWPPRDQPGYRYLRHEPIAKPMVMLAPGTARTGSREHLLQSNERMVLVHASQPGRDDARSLARTARILFAPAVAPAFAARHDMFDGAVEPTTIRVQVQDPPRSPPDSERERPQPRWVNVAASLPRQGLPQAFIEEETRSRTPRGGDDSPLPSRLRLRALRERREVRRTPYFPDPAAAFLVLRLAHPTSGEWLEEPPLVLRLRAPIEAAGPDAWPDVLPVRLELVAAETTQRRRLSDGGWGEESAPAVPSGPEAGARPPGLRLRVARVALARGEAVKLRAWLVPDAADLAAWFDVVEKAATLARAEAGACGATGAGAALEGLATLLDGKRCEGSTPALAAAAAFHAHLLAEPLAAICDTEELELVHASDAPAIRPEFVPGTVALARPKDLEPAALTRFFGEVGAAESWGPAGAADDESVALLPGGAIVFDPATTSGLVVEAEIVAPGQETLDPPPRVSRPELVPEPSQALPFALTRDGEANFRPALPRPGDPPEQDPKLRPHWVPLVTISNIPQPADARAGRRTLRLEELFAGVAPGFAGAKIAYEPALKQPQARQLRLRVVAQPRNLDRLTASPITKRPPAVPTRPNGLDGVPSETLGASPVTAGTRPITRDADPIRRSVRGPETAWLWAPATARPAPPNPKDLLPTLEWSPLVRRRDGGTLRVEGERRAGLRLWLRRPWFTSGEDERLAIVLWPPLAFALMDNETAVFAPDDRALRGLHEDDLGPLGRFVSVWGYDPIGAGPLAEGPQRTAPGGGRVGEVGATFAVQSATSQGSPEPWRSSFLGRQHIAVADDARFHPHVLLPVPGQGAPTGQAGSRETMAAVSVLSAPVRFASDLPGSEPEPYVDVVMRLPVPQETLFRLGLARLQEHARPDRRGPPREGVRAGIRLSAPVTLQGRVPPPRRFGVTATPMDARQGAPGPETLISVTLAGPVPADLRAAGRRVRMELRERRGADEIRVTQVSGQDARLEWLPGEARQGIEHRVLSGEERWTGVFHLPGDALREDRDLVVRIEEEGWLPSSAGGPPSVALPRFAVSLPLKDG